MNVYYKRILLQIFRTMQPYTENATMEYRFTSWQSPSALCWWVSSWVCDYIWSRGHVESPYMPCDSRTNLELNLINPPNIKAIAAFSRHPFGHSLFYLRLTSSPPIALSRSSTDLNKTRISLSGITTTFQFFSLLRIRLHIFFLPHARDLVFRGWRLRLET